MVCRQYDQVSGFTDDQDGELAEANEVGPRPISESPMVVWSVLHHVQALVALICQSRVHDESADEPADHSLDTLRALSQRLKHAPIIDWLRDHVSQKDELRGDEKKELCGDRNPMRRVNSVWSLDGELLLLLTFSILVIINLFIRFFLAVRVTSFSINWLSFEPMNERVRIVVFRKLELGSNTDLSIIIIAELLVIRLEQLFQEFFGFFFCLLSFIRKGLFEPFKVFLESDLL